MTSSFRSFVEKRQYILLCVATFLCFLTTSTLTLLSVILDTHQYSPSEIGLVLSSPIIPVLVALLAAGALSRRFGALHVMLVGQLITSVSFVLFELGIGTFLSAMALRAMVGLGFGLYFTASMIYARQILSGPNLLYYFGIFASMIPLPNAIGPFAAEIYIKSFGTGNFFLIMLVPSLIGIGLLFWAIKHDPIYAKGEKAGSIEASHYPHIRKNINFYPPALGIFFVGLVWGFAVAYFALYLKNLGISVGLFFAPLTALLFLSRFGLLRYLQRLSNPILSFWSLLLLGISYFLASVAPSGAVIFVSGLAFGLGYSLAFPVLSVWSTTGISDAARPKAIALFNAFFHGGMFLTPLLVGLMPAVELRIQMLGLAGLSCIISVVFLLYRSSKNNAQV